MKANEGVDSYMMDSTWTHTRALGLGLLYT